MSNNVNNIEINKSELNVKEITESNQEFLNILAKIYHEAILLKKLTYKIKNQMRHFKIRQYIEELFKFIIRHITQGLQHRKGQQSKLSVNNNV